MGLQQRYARLKDGWLRGERGRESDLDLLFHAWMHWADPPFVTGLQEDPEASRIWHEIYSRFGGTSSTDVEFLFVAKIMSTITPWALGDEAEWNRTASELDQRLQANGVERLDRRMFEGKGEYGKYFAHQLSSAVPPNTSLERRRER